MSYKMLALTCQRSAFWISRFRSTAKSKDFFDVGPDPWIAFHSGKIVQTGPTSLDVPGTCTIRGISKPETLTFMVIGTRGSVSVDV